ncbi:MAG: NAD(P)-binding domain-containing protein [Thermodesulfobacteriota bacterium]|nr:NAD(P)-binding domain-containing protein [Thermodesulfobacteriota bacterium]
MNRRKEKTTVEYKVTDPSIAVIGTGYWGKNLVRNFSALGALQVIVDTNSEILDRMARDYPDAKVTTSYSEVLNDPDIAVSYCNACRDPWCLGSRGPACRQGRIR